MSIFTTPMFLTIVFLATVIYGVIFAILWGWSAIHALLTPREDWTRRALWTASILVNPSTAIWYWFVWKRWAFWTLFVPAMAFLAFLPITLQAIIHAFAVRDLADRFVAIASIFMTNVVDAIPLVWLVPLVAFPFVLRFMALAHLGANSSMKAADRNDYAVAFALPVFGFGAAFAYCLRWRRVWASLGLVWYFIASATVWSFIRFLAP